MYSQTVLTGDRSQDKFVRIKKNESIIDHIILSTRYATVGCFSLSKSETAELFFIVFKALKEWNLIPNDVTEQKNLTNFIEIKDWKQVI